MILPPTQMGELKLRCIENEREIDMVTAILHAAAEYWKGHGLEFKTATQTREETIGRLGSGVCIVAFISGKMVGTVTVENRKISGEPGWYFSMLGVLPEYQRAGIASCLLDYVERCALLENCIWIGANTATKAHWLVSWYCGKRKFRKIRFLKHDERNYYSVEFIKRLQGNEKTSYVIACWMSYQWSIILYFYRRIKQRTKTFLQAKGVLP